MKSLKFKIVTAQRVVFEDEVFQATLPIVSGEVTILPDHIPYIGVLKTGEIIVRKDSFDGEEISLAVSGGFVEFHNNTLTILADMAERSDEINLEEARQAQERAAKLLEQSQALGAEEYGRVAAALERELLRVKIARKHHAKQPRSLGGDL